MLLEVCAYNIQSCLVAARAGAGRIELCADPLQGGVTPSFGVIQLALERAGIPIFPMIRPRGGDFVYDADELAVMKKDILRCRQLGCPGIAVGVLLPGGRIDREQMERIAGWAHPMAVTCHKVFDRTPDAWQALEDVITAGCTRVLTSGLRQTAVEGAGAIAMLVKQAAGRICVMPGGGVRSGNIAQLAAETHAAEYHSSCITAADGRYMADEDEIRAIAGRLNM